MEHGRECGEHGARCQLDAAEDHARARLVERAARGVVPLAATVAVDALAILHTLLQTLVRTAGPGRCCLPRHRHTLEPSFRELSGILRRAEQHLPGPTQMLPSTSFTRI